MHLVLETKYGAVHVSRHAIERWRQRTGRNLPQLVEAVSTARRPTKRELRKIMKRERGFLPKRILECQHAYFILAKHVIVTVYDKK